MTSNWAGTRQALYSLFKAYRDFQIILDMWEQDAPDDCRFLQLVKGVDEAVNSLPEYQRLIIRNRFLYGINEQPSDTNVVTLLQAKGWPYRQRVYEKHKLLALQKMAEILLKEAI